MKILFIGPYRQNDGWGNSARLYIKAMKEVGVDLALRPAYYINDVITDDCFPEENISFNEYDAVIQMCLPSEFCYKKFGNEKIIGLFLTETNEVLETSLWGKMISSMDAIFCTNKYEADHAKRFNPLSYNISHPVDAERFKNADKVEGIPDTYNFYFIGELVERKNIEALLTAFHLEFEPHENVNLVVKTSLIGMPNQSVSNMFNQLSTDIKNKIRKFSDINRYKKEIVLTGNLPEKIYNGLHSSCNCFVMPSRGESVCIPLLEAMSVGNQCIITENTCMELLSKKLIKVSSVKEPVMVNNPPLKEIYKGTEYWHEISIFELRQAMRDAFVSSKKVQYPMGQYGLEAIGQNIVRSVNDVINNS